MAVSSYARKYGNLQQRGLFQDSDSKNAEIENKMSKYSRLIGFRDNNHNKENEIGSLKIRSLIHAENLN